MVSTFVYGLKANVPDYMVRGGVTYRIISDWRGSVRLVLNATETGAAAVVEQLDYDEWGNLVSLVDPACQAGATALCWQPFGFAGGVFDVTTGIVRFGARDYDPQERRWQQKDPIRMVGGVNLYQYAGDDPINSTDWTGKDPASVAVCQEGCAGAAVLGFEGCLVLAEFPPALAACESSVALGDVFCEVSCATGGWPFPNLSCGPS